MKRPVLLLLLPLAAACAAEPPLARGALPTRAETTFVVRTAAVSPAGVDLEVRGIACSAETPDYRVAFRSPARVSVPYPGAEAQPVRVRCAGGGRAGERVLVPRVSRGYGGGYGAGGLVAYPSVGIGIGSGGDFGIGIGTTLWPCRRPGVVGRGRGLRRRADRAALGGAGAGAGVSLRTEADERTAWRPK
jgi:hypothetical protein